MEQNPSSEADSCLPEVSWGAELVFVFQKELCSLKLAILTLTAEVTSSLNYLTFTYVIVFT
jgi:hypothetical protein